jgi:hypothetical protein
MISNWILDISIGCLLLISIGLFYETTVIFYTMFNWWMIILFIPFALTYALLDLVRNTKYIDDIGNESEILEDKYIKPVEQYNLVNSIAIIALWLVPIVIDLLFGSVAIFIAHLLNPNLNSDDVYLICLTPATLLIVFYCSRKVYEMLSNDVNEIKHPIYNELGVVGVIANTCVMEWGGYSITKILEIVP